MDEFTDHFVPSVPIELENVCQTVNASAGWGQHADGEAAVT